MCIALKASKLESDEDNEFEDKEIAIDCQKL